MFSHTAFSELPFATIDEDAQFAASLVTFYLSSHNYVSGTTDSVANQDFEPRAIQPFRINRSITNGFRFGGITKSLGEVELINTDGGIDKLMSNFSVVGRGITIKLGEEDWSYDDFGDIFIGKINNIFFSEDAVRLEIRGSDEFLEQPIQSNTYAGTGDDEGGTDLLDKYKPLAYGRVKNVSPPLVDTTDLLYQLHDGTIQAVDNVYDRGVALTQADDNGGDYATVAALLAATVGGGNEIEPGEYATCLADGFIRLGGDPDGLITCDFRGSSDPSYINTTSDIIVRILENQASLDSTNINYASFAELNTDNSFETGVWVGVEETLVSSVLEELLISVGAFGEFCRDNRFTVGVIKAVTGAIKFEFDDTNIIELDSDITPDGIDPPIWRTKVGYQRNYTIQDDVAGSVDDTQRAFVLQEYRIEADSDASILNDYLLGQDSNFVPTNYALQANAATEASRLLTLWKDKHHILRITTKHPFKLKINDVVKITYDRFGLDSGKLGNVVSIEEDAANYTTTVGVLIIQ